MIWLHDDMVIIRAISAFQYEIRTATKWTTLSQWVIVTTGTTIPLFLLPHSHPLSLFPPIIRTPPGRHSPPTGSWSTLASPRSPPPWEIQRPAVLRWSSSAFFIFTNIFHDIRCLGRMRSSIMGSWRLTMKETVVRSATWWQSTSTRKQQQRRQRLQQRQRSRQGCGQCRRPTGDWGSLAMMKTRFWSTIVLQSSGSSRGRRPCQLWSLMWRSHKKQSFVRGFFSQLWGRLLLLLQGPARELSLPGWSRLMTWGMVFMITNAKSMEMMTIL